MISTLASAQHGVVSRANLIELGMSSHQIQGRIAAGNLLPIHVGVYAVGHEALTARGRWMAAVLACGSGSALSHRSAAALWGIAPPTIPIELVRSIGGDPQRGLWVHRSRFLPETQIQLVDWIPVTSVARTLVDFAGVGCERDLEDAYWSARRKKIVSDRSIIATLDLTPNRKGAARLRRLANRTSALGESTRSVLESRFLSLCEKSELPTPQVNARIGDRIVDFFWSQQGLIVEVDSVAFHEFRFTQDRLRDMDHLASGLCTVRITHRMIEDRPEEVVRRIQEILDLLKSGHSPRGRVPGAFAAGRNAASVLRA